MVLENMFVIHILNLYFEYIKNPIKNKITQNIQQGNKLKNVYIQIIDKSLKRHLMSLVIHQVKIKTII